ncbi:hypothetical protein [Intestinibacillus massiliensis]|uniref:hypothetical protein n=1 Tax=Intestinibacillus massiliensis TaxID=1871029 RepID=UPI000B363249|nr:hypothetical protein [Intestinibacillus massiliensis]
MNVRPRFKFQHAAGSYAAVFVIGLFAGLITRLTDLLPSDTIWGWGSIATLFGFWIVSATLLTYFSSSNRNAGLNVSLYLFSMSLSFYVLQYAFGLFSARFDNGGFKTNLFILYAALSAVCGLVCYVLYAWNNGKRYSSVLYALPAGGLAAETLGVGVYLANQKTFLFQFLFDLISLLLIGLWFGHKARHRAVYGVTLVLSAVLEYLFFYRPFL